MGVYINMEMPTSFINVRIYSDGRVISQSFSKFGEQIATAIHVPPHGDLIDRDALYKEFERNGWFDNADRDIAEDVLLDAPTVIEAKEGET